MSTPIISASKLTRHYEVQQKQEGLKGSLRALVHRETTTVKAVDGVGFDIHPGELVGFIGPNGAGKTTTLKMLSGLLHPTAGSVEVLGFKPYERKEDFLKQISFVMGQKNQLWWDIPPIESFNLNRDIYEVPERQYREILDELVELLDLKDVLHQQVRRLSLGQRMKCELVAALVYTPKVLFLDEPTLGLDVVVQKKIREFIKAYNRRHNATVMLTSHYMDDVKEICDRVIVIDGGKVLFDGRLEKLVQKYATHKTLTLIFNGKVTHDDLKKYGEVVEFSFPKAVLSVPGNRTSKVAAELLTTFSVADINIDEPRLEDVVHSLFSDK
ncbi:MAG TPA: ATP-binding cassette domain-containing protein [Candidatus Saccharimonadales bacterium]|nr:ATP-binding cassette domain-containing protein [Candidatus Saccharimonadales bacterium]